MGKSKYGKKERQRVMEERKLDKRVEGPQKSGAGKKDKVSKLR